MAEPINIFLSAGGPATEAQKNFIAQLKIVLQAEHLVVKSAPLASRIEDTIKYIEATMGECSGAIILAFERILIEQGEEFRGGHLPKRSPKALTGVKLTTVWNQIEAAVAELRGLPLLIIFEEGLRIDGFLEHNTWRPIAISLDPAQLHSEEFRQRLADWKIRVEEYKKSKRLNSYAARRRTIGSAAAIALVSFALAGGFIAGGLFGYHEGSRIFAVPFAQGK
jgi:hypothetical protein